MSDHNPLISGDDTTFTLIGVAGHYTFSWPGLLLQAEVSGITKQSSGSLKAEIQIMSQRPGVNPSGQLLLRQVDLLNPSKNYVKALEDEDGSVNWNSLVNQLCHGAISAYRTGVPETEIIGQIEAEPEGHWLVSPLIQVGHPTLIYGEGSSGKSWFAQYISILVREGLNASGLEIRESKRVLYLDWETDLHELGSRLSMIRHGLGLPKSHETTGIVYKSMMRGLSEDIDEVRRLVHRHKIGFIVLDSLGSACAGEPESAWVVLDMFNKLRSLSIGSLLIDHTNKNDILFGSVYKKNQSRQMFHIKKSQREGDQELQFGVFHDKANNSRLLRPLGWSLHFDNDAGTAKFDRQDVKDTRLESEMTVRERIRNLLSENGSKPWATNEIADRLGKATSHISKELSDNKDIFTQAGKGLWTVIKSQEQQWAEQSVEIPPVGGSEWAV